MTADIERMAEAGQALAIKWGHQAWRCECGDLNRDHESSCFRCGAGR